jgi:hypothetical protein
VAKEPPIPVLLVPAPPKPVPLVTVPLLLLVIAVADGVPPLVEAIAVLLPALVALAPLLPAVVLLVLAFPLTLSSAPESSAQPQAKQRAAKAGKYRDLSM